MKQAKRKRLVERRAMLQKRLEEYLRLESEILSDPVQSYTIGSRSLSKYNLSLDDLYQRIEDLQDEIDEIDALLDGGARRATRHVVPLSW